MSLIPPDSASTRSSGSPVARTPQAGRTWRRASERCLLLLGSVAAALLMGWLTIHWAILPHIQQWRGWVEERAGEAMGAPVRIGRIEVRTQGWMPSFELQEVTLAGADGLPAVRLPRVRAALSAASLLALRLDFSQLLIDGPELELRRDAAGHLFVAGIDLGPIGADRPPGAERSNPYADWFFRQREVIVRGGRLRWIDERLGAVPPLAFTEVQFVARNGLRHHDLRLDASPPPGWGERFGLTGRFTQPLLAAPGEWGRWAGTAYLDLPRADLGEWQRRLELPGGPGAGTGALRAWVEVAEGRATGVTLDLALAGVSLRPVAGVKPLTLTEVAGRLIGSRDRDGASLEARELRFQTDDGIDWRGGNLSLAWQQREGQPVTGGKLSADRLDIGLAARIAAGSLPVGDAKRALLADWRPEGVADRIEVQWKQPPGAALSYRVKGRLSGLALAARPSSRPGGIGRPGVRNAGLDVDAGEGGGSARLELTKGSVELPGVFDEPVLAFDRLGGRLEWKIEAPPGRAGPTARPAITVQFRDVRFANPDAQGRVEGRWSNRSAPSERAAGRRAVRGGTADADDGISALGRLELDGQLTDGVASRLHRYLPLALPRATRTYLREAIQGGRLTTASVRIRGDLRRFPFFPPTSTPPEGQRPGTSPPIPGGVVKPADGEFRILAHADDLRFAYVPGPDGAPSAWPVLTGAGADLALEQGAFSVRNAHGRTGELDWDGITGRIGPLGGPEAVLTLAASAAGPLGEMLRLVNASPVGGWLGDSLATTVATGQAGLSVNLTLPLLHIDTGTAVDGRLTLAGDNDLRFVADSPPIGQAHGRVDFSRAGFTLVGTGGRVYGGEAVIEGGTRPDGGIGFSARGRVSADGLRQAPELGPVARFATVLTGETDYSMNLGFAHRRPQITVASDLVGVAIDLPAPLGKPAEAPLAMRYRTQIEPPPPAAADPRADAATGPLQESLQLRLGDRLEARYLREVVGATTRVLHGGIGVGAEVPVPAAGVSAHLRADRLDADAWQAAFDRIFPDAGPPGAAADTTGGGPPAGAEAVSGGGYPPDTVALQVDDLRSGTRRLTHLTAGLSQLRPGGPWRANVAADQLAGYVEFRAPSPGGPAGAGAGRVYARLSRLVLPKSEAAQISNDNLADPPPASLPSLDVVVDDLELNGLALGRVEVQATNRPAVAVPPGEPSRQAGRDWRLTKLTLDTAAAQLQASGRWTAPAVGTPEGSAPAPRRMLLDFKLQVADSGALLDRLGTPRAIKGGKGELVGNLAWAGSPLGIDYPSLSGQFGIRIEQGQFLKVDPGAARLLGVLSLQSLPRRLTLDFRDLFDQGFAFDEISGDVAIAHGVARSRNLRMRGVQALVLMEGSADIERETEDLRVVVVPEINAGTAALAYAVINPVIGIGALVAQALLKKPLAAAGTREFHVVGPWADPKVLPVARRSEEPVPAPADPAASSAAVQNR